MSSGGDKGGGGAEITALLSLAGKGDRQAGEQLIELLYHEMRKMALRAGARDGATISPTVLVHDAYLRLVEKDISWDDRFHFFSVTAKTMRNLLISHVRERSNQKRGGSFEKISLDEGVTGAESTPDLARFLDALEVYRQVNVRGHQVIELKYFAGLTNEEIANGLKISTGTVSGELKRARAWLSIKISKV